MTVATINGIPINYQVKGDGDLVVLISRPEAVRTGHIQGSIKRLVLAAPPWVKGFLTETTLKAMCRR